MRSRQYASFFLTQFYQAHVKLGQTPGNFLAKSAARFSVSTMPTPRMPAHTTGAAICESRHREFHRNAQVLCQFCCFWPRQFVKIQYRAGNRYYSPHVGRNASEYKHLFISHQEGHRTHRIGWLRAAVLGANDGIVSTASLLVGVAAANANSGDILIAGVAGLVAGAMSMAAGEYVSVSSQSDTERADLDRERSELATDGESERNELASIYVKRGLDSSLARQVAEQLMAHDSLAAHARDELGISEITTARPVQAALASAATFGVGAVVPLLAVVAAPTTWQIPVVVGTSILLLALLGALGARTGGASVAKAAMRVTFWGALAMAITAGVGTLFGAAM